MKKQYLWKLLFLDREKLLILCWVTNFIKDKRHRFNFNSNTFWTLLNMCDV